MPSRYFTGNSFERLSDSIGSVEDFDDLEPQDITRDVRLDTYIPVFTGSYSVVFKGRYRGEYVRGS
jgi:hypothetical protein